MQLLGMTPFAWRLGGNICGILMIPLTYMLADKLLKNKKWAVLAALFMALDTFHFAHTRMGTIDSYLVIFCMLEVLFMLKYLDGHKKLNLLWSGLFMGCGITTKWSGCFTALGIAVIFFVDFFKSLPKIKKHRGEILKLAGACVGSFIILPIIIYFGSYMAFPKVTVGYANRLVETKDGSSYYCDTSSNYLEKIRSGEESYPTSDVIANEVIDTPQDVICQAMGVMSYHTGLEDSHPFESPWYSWPFDWKPVWYYAHPTDYRSGYYATISGIGNLVIYLLGVFGVIFQLYHLFTKKPKPWKNLTIIACSFLPYLFIGRAMFLYHYFPTLPFVIIAGTYLMMHVEKLLSKFLSKEWALAILIVIMIFVVTFSVAYYPIVSGMPISNTY
ncbi:MAG: phospholipid carrier-dependent glycosyltransferase, partial [Candidatus Saccharibacteria bacterium]|nr:phospholipid carrier-dependent glycosyltransferase [Candidatus Saccharibacteria bacterium]